MKGVKTVRTRFILLLGVFVSVQAIAQPTPGLADIVQTLKTDSFWTNRPLSISFSEVIDSPDGPGDSANGHTSYDSKALLLANGFKATASMDYSASATTNPIAAAKKVFLESNDYTMSYYLYSASVHFANTGEATIGTPPCRCNEKFWPFSMTPEVVARKLENLKDVTLSVTNINGDSLLLVTGEAGDEIPGIHWQIYFQRAKASWLPIRALMFAGSNEIGDVKTSFNTDVDYFSAKKIEDVVLNHGKQVESVTWDHISAVPGDDRSGVFSVETFNIPERVVVNDYRLGDGVSYMMGFRPPTQEELKNMLSDKEAVTRYQADTLMHPKLLIPNVSVKLPQPFTRKLLVIRHEPL